MAYEEILFVSEARMKAYTALDENVRVDDITPFVLNAQDIYIQPLLGTKFYKHLQSVIKSGIYTDDYQKDLIQDYIAKPLMHYALYLMLPFIKYKVVQKGVLNGASEETGATSLDELKYLSQTTIDTAEFFAARLVKELKEYPNRFPQYQSPGTTGMLPDKSTPYFSGLVIRNKKNGCNVIEGTSSYSNEYDGN